MGTSTFPGTPFLSSVSDGNTKPPVYHKHRWGNGLTGVRERINDLGGSLEIASDHRGTAVRAMIPVTPCVVVAKHGS